jgi:putative ABC transport system permease protein
MPTAGERKTMRIFDLLRLIFDNLRRQKGRVFLTALGVVIGTASIVILVSLANGLQQNVMQQFGGIGALSTIRVMVNWDMGQGGGGGGPKGTTNQPKMITNSTIREIESIPGVQAAIAKVWLEASGVIRVGRLEVYPSLIGINTDDASILDLPMDQGTTQLKRGTAIVGGWIAKNFYDPKARPGSPTPEQPQIFDQRVKLALTKYTADGKTTNRDVDIKVTGLTREVMGEYDYMIIVPMADLEAWNEWSRGKRINRNMEGYPELFIKVENMDRVLEVADKIKEMGFQTSTPLEYVRQIQSTFTMMQIVFDCWWPPLALPTQ